MLRMDARTNTPAPENTLAIASHHLAHPERAADYFNQSLLEDPTRSQEDTSTPTPPA